MICAKTNETIARKAIALQSYPDDIPVVAFNNTGF
jgi:hypothetical protein